MRPLQPAPDGRLLQMGTRALSASPGRVRPQGHQTARIRANQQRSFDPTPIKCGSVSTLEQQLQEMRDAIAAAEASHAEERQQLLSRCQQAKDALRASEAAHAEERLELLTRCQEAEAAVRTSEHVQVQLRIECDIRRDLLAQERCRREHEVGEARQEAAAAQRVLEEMQCSIDRHPANRATAHGEEDSDGDSDGPWDTPGAVCPALLRHLEAMEKELNDLPALEFHAPTPPLLAPASEHHDDAMVGTVGEENGDAIQWGNASRLAAEVLAEAKEQGMPGPTAPSPFQGASVLGVLADMLSTSADKGPATQPRSVLRPTSTLAGGVTLSSANTTRRVRFEDEADAGPGSDAWVAERVAFDPVPWANAWWLPYERAVAGAVGDAAGAAAAEVQAFIHFVLVLALVAAMLVMAMISGRKVVAPLPTGTLRITWVDRDAA
eukprot:TRINITY_DN15108_c0_g1_i2.p1 TRINITY_DN15108_c0_g1~~TRINITY_DN15108_c0_g1_i2.p1  ORF type:complete len:437 (+),score=120.23 TRINITY_DN15108_c0_g1_i2:132-1442(+)